MASAFIDKNPKSLRTWKWKHLPSPVKIDYAHYNWGTRALPAPALRGPGAPGGDRSEATNIWAALSHLSKKEKESNKAIGVLTLVA